MPESAALDQLDGAVGGENSAITQFTTQAMNGSSSSVSSTSVDNTQLQVFNKAIIPNQEVQVEETTQLIA